MVAFQAVRGAADSCPESRAGCSPCRCLWSGLGCCCGAIGTGSRPPPVGLCPRGWPCPLSAWPEPQRGLLSCVCGFAGAAPVLPLCVPNELTPSLPQNSAWTGLRGQSPPRPRRQAAGRVSTCDGSVPVGPDDTGPSFCLRLPLGQYLLIKCTEQST